MRLLLVSNRLPLTAQLYKNEVIFTPSVGGLATGLSSFLQNLPAGEAQPRDYLWIGWPGEGVEKDQAAMKQELARYHAHPVVLSKEEMENFYHGFCNRTIWPLFHYFPSYTHYKTEHWESYVHVNERFCDAVCEVADRGDIIWVHDYHLMLLPAMLRKRLPDLPIGFFLHIPFPSFEVFRLLPTAWRIEILEGLLGADLIGFHTQDYVQYFLRCVSRILGLDHVMGEIGMLDRTARAETFPMGIDFEKFASAGKSPDVFKEKEERKKSFGGARLILSVDRLDYSKGIINRLRGYEEFLEKNRQYHEKVVLILIVVPSRVGVERYQQMKKEIDESVGRINGRFATLKWAPILYQFRALKFNPLVSLYAGSDIILVTPLRDGMNLIAKEYLSSRSDQTGVLILSEMAGAAKELGEAIIINPNNIEEIALALQQALEMPKEEQVRRNSIMQQRLERYTVVSWATDFIGSLMRVDDKRRKSQARILSPSTKEQIKNEFHSANKRLLLLDYDGTLVKFAPTPALALPGVRLLKLLEALSQPPETHLAIISGRDRHSLDAWFGTSPITLIAEHGAWIKQADADWSMMSLLKNDWKRHLLSLFSSYVDRLPGSFVEEKEFGIAYHYREADPDLASIRTKELTDNLVHFVKNTDVQILHGSKVVEMRSAGVNKGAAAGYFLSRFKYDFILAIGDDWTDEDLFRVLPSSAYTIKVGIQDPSEARYNLAGPEDVLRLLTSFL